jgi:hypothetical protein
MKRIAIVFALVLFAFAPIAAAGPVTWETAFTVPGVSIAGFPGYDSVELFVFAHNVGDTASFGTEAGKPGVWNLDQPSWTDMLVNDGYIRLAGPAISPGTMLGMMLGFNQPSSVVIDVDVFGWYGTDQIWAERWVWGGDSAPTGWAAWGTLGGQNTPYHTFYDRTPPQPEPVPEPASTLLLMSTGLGAIGIARRRIR